MATRSQKRKAVAQLASGEFETPTVQNTQSENKIAGPSKSPKVQPENLEEVKTFFRKDILSDIAKISAKNQKKMTKLTVPMIEKSSAHQNI